MRFILALNCVIVSQYFCNANNTPQNCDKSNENFECDLKTILNENNLPKNCATTTAAASGVTGIYKIKIPYSNIGAFDVLCEVATQGDTWTVIQRRMDGSVDFYRPWSEYKKGFGDMNGEFFIGLDKLHLLTTYQPQEMLIILTDFNNITKYAKYSSFEIGSESEAYALKYLGKYSGDAGDSMNRQKQQKFSTYDRDNDISHVNCASRHSGAWWYQHCHDSNLNGLYLNGKYTTQSEATNYGIVWYHFQNSFFYSLKEVKMMIRPQIDYLHI